MNSEKAVREAPAFDRLSDLAYQIEITEDLVGGLEEKLYHVMLPPESGFECKQLARDDEMSPVEVSLIALKDRVDIVNAKLAWLIERLRI